MVLPATLALAVMGASAQSATPARLLDGFESASGWTVVTSDQVTGTLRVVDGADGRALCLDYDFNGVSGYAGLQRELPLDYPADYEFRYRLRGDSPRNDLQFKLIDDSGENVWWVNRTRVDFPKDWTEVVHKRRHISKAWGPAPDPTLRRSRKLEFTVYNSAGGKGAVCFDRLEFRERPVERTPPPRPLAQASVTSGPHAAARAVDGGPSTAWRAPAASPATLALDLGRLREFGGLRLQWRPGEAATDYAIELSDDGTQWRAVRTVSGGNGGHDAIALPESEARHVRLRLLRGQGATFALAEATVEPLAFAATPNDFIKSLASDAPRGSYPRGFHGEQPYWTVVGVDGGREQGLIGEDGAIELARGAFAIEPFVATGGRLLTWADVQATQTLQDGDLPIPSVRWTHADFALDVTAFAHGDASDARLLGRYRLTNTTKAPRDYVLVLAARPFQVNPPSQFLNTTGGVAPIEAITAGAGGFEAAGRRIATTQAADAALASSFDGGEIVERLRGIDWRAVVRSNDALRAALATTASVRDDPTGLASAALLYRVRLAPGASAGFDWRAPLTGAGRDDPRPANALQAETAAQWRNTLDAVRIRVPPQGQPLVDSLRTALAHMLISRIGPRLQPGTRSYARAWVRDGAMISEGLLRMGREDVAEEFLRWYAPFQFDNGKVPCCVDDRGSDPVPENDSHGQLVFTAAEVYRYTRDRALLEAMWPRVVGAVRYMDQLRLSERTEANRAVNPAFFGMMPASISHEGYSAKPMHSYWDNFWSLRGYKDAVFIAEELGREREARRFAASRDQFAADLDASLRAAMALHRIDYLPGAAELGDFDATSTTIALAPGGEQHRLPPDALAATFERYWREFESRRDGTREWKDYTPYELRTVGTFVRLGRRDRAHAALEFFFADQAPRGWKQWAEVVSRTPRKPFFLGDLPHAWVGSDYLRSALDFFAHARERDDALVIGAGLPADWLRGEGVAVDGLRTPHGPLAYTLRGDATTLVLEMPEGLRLPKGGVVLSLPREWHGARATLDGVPAALEAGELRITRLPARAEFVRVATGAR